MSIVKREVKAIDAYIQKIATFTDILVNISSKTL